MRQIFWTLISLSILLTTGVMSADLMLISGVVEKVDGNSVVLRLNMCPNKTVTVEVQNLQPNIKKGSEVFFTSELNPCVKEGIKVEKLLTGG